MFGRFNLPVGVCGVASIEYDIDRARRRVVIRFAGEVDGRMLNAAMARLWEEFPAIGGSDSICDMREFVGNIGFDDIRDVAQAWARFTAGADRGRRTAIVTYDRFA